MTDYSKVIPLPHTNELSCCSGTNTLGSEPAIINNLYKETSALRQDITYVHITDKDYFFMIENQIRKMMPDYEEKVMLPKAENILISNNIRDEELLDFPTEGYYYKTDSLRRYFKIARNLQENCMVYKRIKKTQEVDEFINFFENDIFGKEASDRLEDAIMPRRKDILTLTLLDNELFNFNSTRPWQIDDVVNKLKYHYSGTVNLVELAYLTKEKECLASGAETNALYREFVLISGCYFSVPIIEYVWDVKKEVQDMGKRLVEAYNKLIGCKMISPDIKNHFYLNKNSQKPRLAHLGSILVTGEYYFWDVNENGETKDFYDTEFHTTETYYTKRGYVPGPKNNIFYEGNSISSTVGPYVVTN